MRIDQLLQNSVPVFSIEFFPPKTPEGVEQLFATVEALKPLEPDFVSVTYGAGGATRDGTVEIADAHQARPRARGDGASELRRRDPRGARGDPRPVRGGRDRERLALRGDPPRGRRDFGRPRAARQRGRARRLHLRAATTSRSAAPAFPRSTPRRPASTADLAYLKTKVEAGASFLITQLFFDNRVVLRLRRRGARRRDRGADHPRRDPDRELRPGRADLRPLRRDDPALSSTAAMRGARRRPGGRGAARRRLRGAAVRGAAGRRRAGHPLLRAQPGARRRGPCSSALRASRPWERAAASQLGAASASNDRTGLAAMADRGVVPLSRPPDRVRGSTGRASVCSCSFTAC